jgi:arylformamidase
MTFYDISVPLRRNMPTYPGDPGIEISNWLALDKGDPANVSFIKFGAHTGTHIDAPAHFIKGGSPVESLPFESLIGETSVVELPSDCEVIDEKVIEAVCSDDTSRVLFKTRNSEFWSSDSAEFRTDYTYLSVDGAKRLTDIGVKLVGIDYLSIEKFHSEDFATHHLLLSRGVVIVEGLDLRGVPQGSYELICLPLRIRGGHGDGAPARAILRTMD